MEYSEDEVDGETGKNLSTNEEYKIACKLHYLIAYRARHATTCRNHKTDL